MGEERVQRRLAAIVAADVVGYSRLMEQDETGTLARMKSLRADVLSPRTHHFGGRIFKNTGDGALAEFPSAVDAVQCAIEIQRTLAKRNSDLPANLRIILRIGISLGDVIVEGDDIYGNGVNVAARMETLAEAGAICVSGNVYEHVGNALDVTFEDLGDKTVKNINRPVRSYQIRPEPSSTGPIARQPISLPEKPSIAVLPFQNMSGNSDQEFFSDGITDDIITELARYEELFVIARNSTFAYKGRDIDARQIASELGVATVLEGSVRRAGGNVRVTAQLVEASSGSHIWAERYDRNLKDIFAVQDEITAMIVNTLAGKLAHQHYKRALQNPPSEMDAYDHALRAMIFFQKFTPTDNVRARAEAEAAIRIDPEFARAHAIAAWTHGVEGALRWGRDPKASFQKALKAATTAISINDQEPLAHSAAGYAEIMCNHAFDRGLSAFERSVFLNPNNAQLRSWYAIGLCFSGRPEDGLREIELAMRLNPHYPPIYLNLLGRILFVLRRFDDALPVLERLVTAMPHNTSGLALTGACYAALGREEEAKAMIENVLKVSSDYRLEVVHYSVPYARSEDLEFYCEMLRRSGLPE